MLNVSFYINKVLLLIIYLYIAEEIKQGFLIGCKNGGAIGCLRYKDGKNAKKGGKTKLIIFFFLIKKNKELN